MSISTIDIGEVKAANRPRLQARTETKPHIAVRVKIVSYPHRRQRARARRLESVVCHGLLLGFLTFMAFGVSSIAGQVMVEQSRREEVKAKTTTLTALREMTSLKSHIAELTRPETILSWANDHEFTNGSSAISEADRMTPVGHLAVTRHHLTARSGGRFATTTRTRPSALYAESEVNLAWN